MHDGGMFWRAVLALVSNAVMPLGRGREWFPPLSEPLGFGEQGDMFEAGDLTTNRPVETSE
jgi:hypothetical protein